MKKQKIKKPVCDVFKNMGGNMSGGDFPGWSSPGEFDWWEFLEWEFSSYPCKELKLSFEEIRLSFNES